MSSSIVVWPIIKALCMASQFLGINPAEWQAGNQQHQIFLADHFALRDQSAAFSDTELRAWASTDYAELNAILKRENFSIQLDPFDPSSTMGVVSILDIQAEWLYSGTKSALRSVEQGVWVSYPSVVMHDGFTIYQSPQYSQPIMSVETKTGDTVFMAVADQAVPLHNFELIQWIRSIKSSYCAQAYDSIEFPMIDLDQENDITWLLGMQLGQWQIAQALQQTKLKINEVGAHAKSAAAIALRFTCPAQSPGMRRITIDKPFYLWIQRPGVTDPIFAGYITQEHWKDPKNLEL